MMPRFTVLKTKNYSYLTDNRLKLTSQNYEWIANHVKEQDYGSRRLQQVTNTNFSFYLI